MKRITILVLTLAVSFATLWGAPTQGLKERLRDHIEYLSSTQLAGRRAGSSEGYAAGDYVAKHFAEIGLIPFERADYFHPFTVMLEEGVFRNVVGQIKGSQPNSYIVIGAHYDHLGVKRGKTYPGADDNASGVAALIEIARILSAEGYKPNSTLVFAAFDAEEIGLYGSEDLAARFPKGSVKAMLNLDMVGWLKDGSLQIEGTGTLEGAEKIIIDAAAKHQVAIRPKKYENMPMVATDTEAFALNGVPTLSMTTGLHSAYHKPEDTADKIDYEGVEKTTLLVTELARQIDTSRTIAPTGKVARKHRSGINEFEWGLSYAFGNNHYHYPNTAFVGRDARAWSLGISSFYALKNVGFRLGANYNRRKALTPTDVADPFGEYVNLTTNSLTIPFDVMLKTSGRSSLFLTVGGYWSYTLSAAIGKEKLEIADLGLRGYEIGAQWGFGFRISDIAVEYSDRYALTPAYKSDSGMPHILNRSTICSLTLYF